MSSSIMRDHARPLKKRLLSGYHRCTRVVLDVNLDHCGLALVVGVLIGYLAFHPAQVEPAPVASPYHQKFEVRIPQ